MLTDEDFKALTSLGGMGALAAAVRCIIDNQRTFMFFCTTFILCVFVSLISGYIVKDMAMSEGWKNAVVGGSALTARELIVAAIRSAEMVRDNVPGVIKSIITRKGK